MKAVMVMFDTLNRRMLPPYGCDWTKMPNFQRLAQRSVTFDNAYVGSMPCMPARRELHTGRYNFLHRSWGPLEPFDDSTPELLWRHGVYTHLSTDHYHYFEDGGATYQSRYRTWDFSRGHEGDPWIGQVAEPERVPCLADRGTSERWRQDFVNRPFMAREELQPQAKTFAAGLDFLRRNHDQDSWFLHIETFDPHEPFFTQQHYKDLYPHDYEGPRFDWPTYGPVTETPEQVAHCRYEYAALLSMCDAYLGKVLDLFDEYGLWEDTMLIVNTDHGFLLGEHDCWAKCWAPFYQEVAHMPLFVWDPRTRVHDVHRQALVQTIDLPATLLDFFNVALPPDMQGVPLRQTILDDTPVRSAALFGLYGAQVNVTDGRYVYMRGPADRASNGPLYQYTHMPTHMTSRFSVEEMRTLEKGPAFSFTKGCPTMRLNGGCWVRDPNMPALQTYLFDLESDYEQRTPIDDPAIEQRMIDHLVRLMKWNDAPREQFQRLGLPF